VLPGARTAIEGARASGAATAILSNADTRLRTVAEAFDLPVDALFFSSEIGAEKPDPQAFEIVAQAFGLSAERCIQIGDTWPTDIVGALQAGWSGVWLGDEERPLPPRVQRVSCLAQIGPLLAELSPIPVD
jgi:putative hydrolase of the HAD superfamily